MVNLFNDSSCKVQIKYGGFEPFVSKFIFVTSTKPPEEAYNFNQDDGSNDSNKRNFGQFARRLDFVVEFDGCWHDDIEKRTTEISFKTCDLPVAN